MTTPIPPLAPLGVDSQGHPIDQGALTPALTAAKKKAVAAAEAAKVKAKQEQLQVAALNGGYVWVDGKARQVTGVDADGTLHYSLAGVKDAQTYKPPSAYNILDAGSIPDAATQFLMTEGPADIFTGQAGLNYGPPGSGDHSASANTVSGARNLMTVGQGMQWLANLSAKTPDAYSQMVEQLHDAGYLGDSDYATSGGGYSSGVGLAFARAAADLSALNFGGTDEGLHTDLGSYLEQRATANKALAAKAKADAYTPVQRNFTDPEEIKAQARAAAQSAIGRALTPTEEAALTAHFHGQEATAYDQIDAAGRAGTAATITTPSATGQIGAFLDQGNLAQEQANYEAAGYGGALRKLFGLGG